MNPTLSNHTSTNPTLTNPVTPNNPSHFPLTDAMLRMFYLCQSTLTSHGGPIRRHLSCTTHGHGQRTRGTLLTQNQCPMVMDSNPLPILSRHLYSSGCMVSLIKRIIQSYCSKPVIYASAQLTFVYIYILLSHSCHYICCCIHISFDKASHSRLIV